MTEGGARGEQGIEARRADEDGVARVMVGLYVRSLDGKFLIVYVRPNSGTAELKQMLHDNKEEAVADRDDLAGRFNVTDWNRLAMRVRGLDVWVLLNDEPILFGTSEIFDAGGIGLYLQREGNPDDEYETAVVFRDLTLSTIEGADPSRAPTRP
jgi:hypothetical protein